MDSFNSELLVSNMERVAIQKGLSKNKVLVDSGAGKDFITNIISKKQIPSIFKVAQIALYLDCSVDYLLGRTDNPDAHKLQANSTISQSNINSDNDNSIVDVNPAIPESDGLMQEFMNAFKELSFDKKIKAMDYVNKLK